MTIFAGGTEDQASMVLHVMLSTGALIQCPVHEEVYDPLDPGGVQDAIDRGHRMIDEGELLGTKDEWEDRVRATLDEYGSECTQCPDPDDD